jgi:hypothetical protein
MRKENKIEIFKLHQVDSQPQDDQANGPSGGSNLVKSFEFKHDYPANKIMWAPPCSKNTELMITAAEHLRIWRVQDSSASLISELKGTDTSQPSQGQAAPLTCFDWHQKSPNLLATSALDSVC